ncbi:MAG: sugar phosphate isomerase/epimerase family protein [Planctomycetota bacterium]
MQRVDRRRFLSISLAALAGARARPSARALAEASEKTWNPPVSIRDRHLGAAGEKDCWTAARALGVDGLEVLVDDDLSLPGLARAEKKYSIADERSIEELATALERAKVKVTAFCLSNRFDERPDLEARLTISTVRAAKALAVPAVRIDVVPHREAGEGFLESTASILRKTLAETEATGVRLAVENHGSLTNRPDFLDRLFSAVESGRLGLTLDTANFYWFGHPLSRVYELYEKYAARTFHTHLKNIRYPEDARERERPMGWKYEEHVSPIDEGDIDFRRVLGILRKAGYSGDLCIEDEALGHFPAAKHKEILAREVRFLRSLL